jgi:sirohydrochlorin cobaltochelatase
MRPDRVSNDARRGPRLQCPPMEHDAVILFAHGARDPAWAAPFERVLAHVRAGALACDARLAFLEFMRPDLATLIADMAGQGRRAIRVVPLFLGPGGHLRRELPELVAAARAAHPGVRIDLKAAAGEDEGVAQALAAYCLR